MKIYRILQVLSLCVLFVGCVQITLGHEEAVGPEEESSVGPEILQQLEEPIGPEMPKRGKRPNPMMRAQSAESMRKKGGRPYFTLGERDISEILKARDLKDRFATLANSLERRNQLSKSDDLVIEAVIARVYPDMPQLARYNNLRSLFNAYASQYSKEDFMQKFNQLSPQMQMLFRLMLVHMIRNYESNVAKQIYDMYIGMRY